jgi:hypothetical protein
MRAMPDDGHHGYKHSEYADRERDGPHSIFASLFHLLGKLIHFGRFHSEGILREPLIPWKFAPFPPPSTGERVALLALGC